MCSLGRFTLAIVLLLAALAGCDGRGGSSGFDINHENAAIRVALTTQECVDFGGLMICPANVTGTPTPTTTPAIPTPTTSRTATVTPGSEPRVDTVPGNATAIDCVQYAPGSCTSTLTFIPQAFPPGTTFRVLSRAGTPDSPWVLGADPVPSGVSGVSSFNAMLVLTGPPGQVQFAVLAFTAAPPSAPMEFQQLLQTHATFAFVAQVLTVNVLTVCCQCPEFCAAPAGGTCGGCSVVIGATCSDGSVCTQPTPTPTVTPTNTVAPTITPESPTCLRDNGDGTISDACTGLMWEKKDLAGGLHDAYAIYTWAGVCSNSPNTLCQPDAGAAAVCADATDGALGCDQCAAGATCNVSPYGPSLNGNPTTTIWGWLQQLNEGEGFAGHNDWRIPTVDRDGDTAELDTILPGWPVFNINCPQPRSCDALHPCSAGLSCVALGPVTGQGICRSVPGCTVTSCSCPAFSSSDDWSATSVVPTADTPAGFAWCVSGANAFPLLKTRGKAVRAVRGGSVTPKPTRTPTPTSTPGANDCCQCPSSCAAPFAGDCGSCTVVFGAACEGGLLCAPGTPTPTCVPTDNGDGTITDACTGLMWEKKDQAGGLHDYSTVYVWAGLCADEATRCQPNAAAAAACAAQTGGADGCGQCARGVCEVNSPYSVGGASPSAATTIWDWLNQLNSSAFAGHNDWRIPTVGQDGDVAELETVLAAPYPTCLSSPCVPPAFNTNCSPACDLSSCSCTQPSAYWSASSAVAWVEMQGVLVPLPGVEWTVYFGNPSGFIDYSDETSHHYVRAVRGGL